MTAPTGQTLTVNGEPRETTPATLTDLIRHEGLDPTRRGLAVALNGQAVPRAQWDTTALAPGDAVEIVKPFSGG
jgi:sulfur carrier protein